MRIEEQLFIQERMQRQGELRNQGLLTDCGVYPKINTG